MLLQPNQGAPVASLMGQMAVQARALDCLMVAVVVVVNVAAVLVLVEVVILIPEEAMTAATR